MPDRLILLGTKGGPSIRKGSPSPSASVLDLAGKTMLIDCGIGATRSLVEAGIALEALDAIFITHLHSDHLLELGPLLYTSWTTNLTAPLDLFGPPGIEEYWAHFRAAMSFDHGIRTSDEKRAGLGDLVRVHTYSEGPVTTLGDVTVTALRVDHPPVTDCFALRFGGPDHDIVFSADTCYFPPLAAFATGADTLVHEAMLADGIDTLVKRLSSAPDLKTHLLASHTMAGDVGRIAQAAGIGQLVLNHLIPADDPRFTDDDWKAEIATAWDGPVIVGRDGLEIPLKGARS